MLSELSRRSVIGNNESSFGDDLEKDRSLLLREQRRKEADDVEKELNLYRSGSAPPTVEGSLNAVGGFPSDEELRSDPAYLAYYYANVNLNPRLPPPVLSKEDWRFSQRMQGGGGSSAIGDRRKVIKNDSVRMPPGFNSKKPEKGNDSDKLQGSVEWGGDGLIGLPGLGLGSKQKSIAEIFQDDLSRMSPAPNHHPSRPASRTAFDETGDTSLGSAEAYELSSSDAIGSSGPTSYSYAAALSRSTTPDPQRIARAPSPCLTPIGGGRGASISEKRSVNSPNSFNGATSRETDSADLVAALSSMDLSNGVQNNGKQHGHFPISGSATYNIASAGHSKNVQYPYSGNGAMNPSSFSGYGLSGHSVNPMSSHIGNYNQPPLFENAAGMSVPGSDPRMLGGSNLSSAALEKNISGLGYQMGGSALQASFMDPVYLQFLTAEYVAALNDPSMDRTYMGNSYADLLHKAYVGNVLSPQKSQYSGPSHQGYYGNPAFGVGLSYPGNPLASPIFPNSPVGPGSPIRHSDYNMRFPGGIRNTAGALGPWHLDAMENSFAMSLLDEFKSNKTKCFELSEIVGHVVEFSGDQYGSRFIQQKLETATIEEISMVFQEIIPQAHSLMTDVFGNYVIQKFFEHGMAAQKRELASKLFGDVLTLSLQMYGCRVIQKAIEVVDMDQKIKMVQELDGHVMRCVRDQNGNHVIQKCIECVPEDHIKFIVSTFFGQVVTLSSHPYGCRVIQRVLEHCCDPKTQSKVMEEIMGSVSMLAQDQYGNYVVQHVLEHGKSHERSAIIQELAGKIVQMSQQKFASNVVEKCLSFGNASERQLLVNEMLGTTDENEPLQAMMKDQFANYVVQKVLETCSDEQRELILSRVKVHLTALKKYTYGKHIVARVEKLVTAGERRIAMQSLNPA